METKLLNKKKEIVQHFLDKGILVSQDLLDMIEDEKNVKDIESMHSLIFDKTKESNILVLNKDLKKIIQSNNILDLNGIELEKSKVLAEKNKNVKIYDNFVEFLSQKQEINLPSKENKEKKEDKDIQVLFEYEDDLKKKELDDFVAYFNRRYEALEKILQGRQELQNMTTIRRILGKSERETVAVVGLVSEKTLTRKGDIMLTIEDSSGAIKAHIRKNKPALFEQAKDITEDEVIGVVGVNGNNIIWVNQVVWPDIPGKDLRKADEEGYAVFLSDIHVGSNNFLEKEFIKFLKWIRMETGNEQQKEIASKVKYIFIVGDLVDGVGIYPGQEDELVIRDVYEQYRACAEFLKQIPENIKIIICAGNHDAVRIAEPQPKLGDGFSQALSDLPNVTITSNPGYINVGAKEGFSGFDILLYHGYSFDYFASNVESIKVNGGYDRPDLIMKFMLQRRHLAPTHKSTLYIPDTREDNLVIKKVPDFFVTGHIHKSSVANYKHVTMICGSCWQSKTAFQEKVGHHPEPCRVPMVNLKTRNIKIMKFD